MLQVAFGDAKAATTMTHLGNNVGLSTLANAVTFESAAQ
jgi:hypothetical protein